MNVLLVDAGATQAGALGVQVPLFMVVTFDAPEGHTTVVRCIPEFATGVEPGPHDGVKGVSIVEGMQDKLQLLESLGPELTHADVNVPVHVAI